jgi:O-antigen ligase
MRRTGDEMQIRSALPIERQKDGSHGKYWLFALYFCALVPVLHGLETYSHDGLFNLSQIWARQFSLTTVVAEMAIITLAYACRFSLSDTMRGTPLLVRVALAIWGISAVVSYFHGAEMYIIPAAILARYVIQVVALLSLIWLIKRADSFDMEKWLSVLALGALGYALFLTACALSVEDVAKFPWLSAMPSATSVRHIGNYAAILAIAPAALYLTSHRAHSWRWLVCWIATIMLIAWTGSRAALLGLSVCMGFGWFAVRSSITLKKIFGLIAAFISAILASAFLPTPDESLGVVRLFKITPNAEPTSGRILTWTKTALEIEKEPYIGHGAGRFANNMHDLYGFDVDNPHDFIMQYLYDWGLFGGGAATFLLLYLAYAVYHKRDNQPQYVFPAIAGIVILLFIGLLEGMLYHPMMMLLVMAMIAPLLSKSRSA